MGRGSHNGEDVLMMDGIAQAKPKDLHRLFAGRSTEKEPTKQWFTTQLHLYGIPFKKSGRKADLKDALHQGLLLGKVRLFGDSRLKFAGILTRST
jgi:hypothetical protein